MTNVPPFTSTGPASAPPQHLPLEPDFRRLFDFEGRLHKLTLALGGLPFQVRTDDPAVAEFLDTEFGPFLVDEPPVVILDLARSEEFPFRTQVGSFLTYREGDFLAAKFRGMAACVDAASRWGKGWIRGDNYRQDLINVVRFLVGAITPGLGAMLFHTAAIGVGGRAYLFFGPSSAGKSTVVRLSGEREILTDDMLVLRETPRGFVAATCGFWGGETRDLPTKRQELPVAGFFRLRQCHAGNRLVPMHKSRTAFEVACNVPVVERSPEEHREVLDLATRAAIAAPGYELYFHNRDDSFWSCLDDLS